MPIYIPSAGTTVKYKIKHLRFQWEIQILNKYTNNIISWVCDKEVKQSDVIECEWG